MVINGKSEKIVNTNPTSYENVKVWAAPSTEKYYPTAKARIRNLVFEQMGKVVVVMIYICRFWEFHFQST